MSVRNASQELTVTRIVKLINTELVRVNVVNVTLIVRTVQDQEQINVFNVLTNLECSISVMCVLIVRLII